jgi:hypothetical protein
VSGQYHPRERMAKPMQFSDVEVVLGPSTHADGTDRLALCCAAACLLAPQ